MDFGEVLAPGRDLSRPKVDGRDMRHAGLAIEQGCGCATRQVCIRLLRQHVGLCGLFELDVREAGVGPELLLGPQDIGRERDLRFAERIERMGGARPDGLFCMSHDRTNSCKSAAA